MWKQFSEENHMDAHYDAWAFCGGGEVGDRLAGLVMKGIKTATASAYISYQTENEDIPKAGSYSVILLDNNEAVCIIQTTDVSLVPFNQVSAEHAYLEGEGDRDLAYWRRVHKTAFTPDYQEAGKEFDENGLVVLERFQIVHRP